MMNEALVEVRDMLASSVGTSVVKSYYAGDVGLNYAASLPAVVVRERSTEIIRSSTTKDQYRFGISVLVVMDVRKSFKVAAMTNLTVVHRQALRNLVEEADTDGAPKTTTILGALMRQANLRGTNYVYNLNGRVDYNPPIPGGFFYTAAEITLDLVTDLITRKA